MRFGLSETVIDKLMAVFAKHPEVEEVIIYGSRAKGNFRTGSDIDLTVKGYKIDLSTLYRIERELDDLMLPYKIDLSIWSQIENQDLLDHIHRVGKKLYLDKTSGR